MYAHGTYSVLGLAMKTPASRTAKALLFTGSLALSLLGVEAVLRITGRVPIPPVRVVTHRPDLYQFYDLYGYRLWPSRAMTYRYPRDSPRLLTLRSNRHGFRGRRELDEVDGRPRIVVLGDSMVFGEGVEEDERFTEQLEAQEPAWRVDNLGMTGFGPDLMLRALEQVGLSLKPDVVVLVIFTDDLRRVRPDYAGQGFEIPRFALRSGHLVSVGYPRAHVWDRWRTVAGVRQVMWRLSGAERDLNAAILDRFREHAAQAPFKLVVIFLPSTYDTENDRARRTWLAHYAHGTGTMFVDLTDAILGERAESMFLPNNFHLNPRGHLVVARELRGVLTTIVGTGHGRPNG